MLQWRLMGVWCVFHTVVVKASFESNAQESLLNAVNTMLTGRVVGLANFDLPNLHEGIAIMERKTGSHGGIFGTDLKGDDLVQRGNNPTVEELDSSNFSDFLKKNPKSAILFYVPWCHWCQRFLPMFELVAQTSARIGVGALTDERGPADGSSSEINDPDAAHVAFARIDLNKKSNREIQQRENVLKFPTLKFFENNGNNQREYDNEFDSASVLHWINDQAMMNLEVPSLDRLRELIELHQDEILVINFTNSVPIKKSSGTLDRKGAPKDTSKVSLNSSTRSGINDHQDRLLSSDITTFRVTNSSTVKAFLSHYQNATGDQLMVEYLHKNPKTNFLALFNPHHDALKGSPAPDDDEEDGFFDAVDQGLLDAQYRFLDPINHFENRLEIFPKNPKNMKTLKNKNALQSFVDSFKLPLICRFSPTLAPRMARRSQPFLIAFTPVFDDDEMHQILLEDGGKPTVFRATSKTVRNKQQAHLEDMLFPIASEHRSKFVTIVSGTQHFFEKRMLATLGIEDTPALIYVTMNPTGNGLFNPTLKYIAPDNVKDGMFLKDNENRDLRKLSDHLVSTQRWLRDVMENKIEPNIKSEEPLPDDSNRGPVYAVTGRDFQKQVLDSNVDYLVDFYAPWCGHCRVLGPIYNQIARAFKQASVNTLKLGKIDATANEVPGVHLRGYPTILLYASKKKSQPFIHHGGVDSGEAIINFVHHHATHRFDLAKVLHAFHNLNDDEDIPKLDEEL